MEKTSAWAALYFIVLMTFGNYVLFNLLVAILVEGFSSDEEEKKKEKNKESKEKKLEIINENNNNEQQCSDTIMQKVAEVLDVKINNKEKEKLLGLNMICKNENNKVFTVQPPIITHTEATPMATPQGSPNEHGPRDFSGRRPSDVNSLTLEIPTLNNTNQRLTPMAPLSNSCARLSSNLSRSSSCRTPTVSFRGSTRMSAKVSPKPSPRPSPRLWRSHSYGSRRNSWKFKRTRDGQGDKAKLVDTIPNNNDYDEDDDMYDYEDDDDDDEVFKPNSQPILKQPCSSSIKSQECNGGIPLNNRRVFSSHQNLIFQRRLSSPKNSARSRNNSSSSARSICNSIHLSRQNTFPTRRKINSLSSTGSGFLNEEYKQNNLNDTGNKENTDSNSIYDEEDPDAMDETNCNYSWCPEPRGCFKDRIEYSMYVLGPDNPVRRLTFHIIAQKWFDNTVLLFIALNCITLAMERPGIPKTSSEREFLTISNHIFTAIFALEMTIKVLAKGLTFGKHAYLKSGWNVMDGFLVVISLVDTMISLSAHSSPRIFGILRVFRLLRTLRPLRVISRAPGLKLVVQTLLSSLRPIGNIVLICCTFFIIFGILGVQLFKGTFYFCKGPNVIGIENKTQCEDKMQNVWVNQKYNFDNLGQAIITLFVLASKDGWVSIMYTGLDAVGIDQQPKQNYNEWRLIYFISFLLLVGFFVLNMFVGVVVENFHKCRESQEIEEKARRAEKRNQKLDKKRRQLQQVPYWTTYGQPRLLIYTVINSKYFDLAIAGVIGLNVVTMALEFYMMPKELEFALQIFNYFFTSVFILEAAMKIIALGSIRYMKDRWNQLDIFIVILSIVGIVLEEMKTNVIPINPTIIRVMRVLRIARVLKLLKMAKGIRALLDTVIQALPQVGNLGLLFFLLFFIFAALGVELFGRLECSEEHPCEGLGEHAHFRNFGMAFLTLFRVATGDNWNGIMKDTLRTDCVNTDNCERNCCVNPIIAPIYFVIFVLTAQFVLVNVVVAVLMKHLEESHKMADEEAEIEALLRQQAKEYTRPIEVQNGETVEIDTYIEPPSFILRPPSCEPCPSPNAAAPSGHKEKSGMYLSPVANNYLSIPNHEDRNRLRVPSISRLDGRFVGGNVSPNECVSFDDVRDPDCKLYSRSAVSTPTSSITNQSCLLRPVSDQNINVKMKNRKEKAVSWHSKLPLSTQTLGCMDDIQNKLDLEGKHTQSQPLLGTLESSGSKKHVCRHTYSVKVHSKTKESRKTWNLKRSNSAGTDKVKFSDKCIPSQSDNDIGDKQPSLAKVNKPLLAVPNAKLESKSSINEGKSDCFSLIDWEEDEMICDEEVCNITGHDNNEVNDEDNPSQPLIGSNCDIDISELNTFHVQQRSFDSLDNENDSINETSTCSESEELLSGHKHSVGGKYIQNVEHNDFKDNENATCDFMNSNYALTENPICDKKVESGNKSKEYGKNVKASAGILTIPSVSLLPVSTGGNKASVKFTDHRLGVDGFSNNTHLDEKRPPLPVIPPTEESHL